MNDSVVKCRKPLHEATLGDSASLTKVYRLLAILKNSPEFGIHLQERQNSG